MIVFPKPSDIIIQIKKTIAQATADLQLPPEFITYEQRVGGSGYLSEITETDIQNMQTPSVFVVLADNVTDTLHPISVTQNIYHGFDILVVLDTKDSRKQSVEEQAVVFKDLLVYSLNGFLPFNPDTGEPYEGITPLRFTGDSTIYSDKTKYIRLFQFELDARFVYCEDGMLQDDEYNLDYFRSFFADMICQKDEASINPEPHLEIQVTDLNDE